MARKAPESAHAQLDRLRQQAATERVAARELEAQSEAAKAAVDDAGAAITEAYAADDAKLASRHRTELDSAAADVLDLQHRVTAAGLRVERAQADADAFQADHARELIEEREAEARELAANLTGAGLEAVRLNRAYMALRTEIDGLVAAVPGATSRADGPEPSHPWERQLRDLERASQETPEVPAPLPRWAGLAHRQEQDNAARVERLRRSGELPADDQAALAIGRVVTIK
jgi:hypothetical protein